MRIYLNRIKFKFKMDGNDDHKNQFAFQANLSQTARAKIFKGTINGEKYAKKTIQCSQIQELFYRTILSERLRASRFLNDSVYSLKISEKTTREFIDKNARQPKVTLHIFSPYIQNLKLSHPNLHFEQKCSRIKQIVQQATLLLMSYSNEQLYTLQTFLFDMARKVVHINVTSFAGMELLLYDSQIPKAQFMEIMELLGTLTLQKKLGERFSEQLKFRSLGVLLLSLVLEKPFKIGFGEQQWASLPGESYMQKYKRFTSQSKNKFAAFLTIPLLRQKIRKIEQINKANYYSFLSKLFIQEEQLSWVQPVSSVLELFGYQKTQLTNIYFHSILQKDAQVDQLLKHSQLDFEGQSENAQLRAAHKRIIGNIVSKPKYEEAQKYQNWVFGEAEQLDFSPPQKEENVQFQNFIRKLLENLAGSKVVVKKQKLLSLTPQMSAIKQYSKLFK